jgi:hypothetical protein
MNPSAASFVATSHSGPRLQLRVWHLALLVLYVAIATVDIRDQTRREPFLVSLASAGFAGYGLIGWMGWCRFRRLETRLGATATLVFYLVLMAAVFLVATVAYLVLEYVYLTGGLSKLGRWAGIPTPAILRRAF